MLKMLPTVLLILVMMFGYKLINAGSMSPAVLLLLTGAMLIILLTMKPKKASAAQSNPKALEDLLGEYGMKAFTDDSKPSQMFRTAVTDMFSSKPKAALAKLGKLDPQCRDDAERFAVAVASGLAFLRQNIPDKAIPEFNKALLIHPTPEVAMIAGSCHQRMGQLRKARDSYEFALDLVPNYVEAFSAIATTWVADRKYETAIDFAEEALELDENHASALATMAICQGLLGNRDLSDEYTDKAVNNGYSRKKIEDTIKALRK